MNDRTALLLALALVFAATKLAPSRYELIGATPRGVAVFNTGTGDTEVRMPIPFPTTTTTRPSDEPAMFRPEV